MISTIFKKELKDTLRDRRTLLMMLVIPVLVFPIILTVFVEVSKSFSEKAASKELKIGFIDSGDSYIYDQFNALPEDLGKKQIIHYQDTARLFTDLQNDSIQLGVHVSSEFAKNKAARRPAKVTVYHNATKLGMVDRGKAYMEAIETIAQQERYLDLQLNESELTPIETTYSNIASEKEVIGKLVGGVLPYIFIAFGFLGCMYPAIDLFTGEKERGTIETLLTTPVPRWKILFGKMGVVICSGLLAASFAFLGLFLSIEVFNIVDNPEILNVVHSILSFKFMAMLYMLLVPLTLFFAGVMIPIAVYAKSFKEAQSIITPLNIIMVLPAMIGFFPGVELNAITACIPVVNIVLATKELIAGTLAPELLGLSFAVMALLAFAAVFVSYKRFGRETNIVL